jgi:hypothetical protein
VCSRHDLAEASLHRLREFFEGDGVVDNGACGVALEGLVVREKILRPAEIALGALGVAAHDRVVGALEEAQFAVVDKFHGRLRDP